jgi:hypothetical protein
VTIEVKKDAAYVAMLEARLALAEAKASAASEFRIAKKTGTSKKNGKGYAGWSVTGPAWGYVSDGLLRAIVANVEVCRKALG